MNKFLKIALAVMSVAPAVAIADDAVRVEHLGPNNTLVRVTGDDKLLILPVQEAYDDARVNVIVDGKIEKTFYVRLAKTKVDYTVPFDLSPYKGKNVILDVHAPHDRTGVRDTKNDAGWVDIKLADSYDTTNREKYRPVYHHTPSYGWMNDPNGMFYKDGVWHLYFQWNPYGSKWQNMTWGHSTSKDLVNWELHPAAIEPNGLGAVFSGSSAIDKENSAGFGEDAVVAMYTSAGASQIQSLAWSDDNGETFNIYPGNPVITLDSEARDPNMFWDPATKQWSLVLAHALEKEMLIFTSPDMKQWTLQSAFGKGLGAQDGVWECPDLFKLPVDGGKKQKWVLICNINPGGPFGGSGIQYFVGDFDGKTFKADTDKNGNVPTKWLDHGKDNYALVSWSDAPDGRRTAIGWMSNWQYAAEVPTQQFRSANTLPREIELFTAADGQIYAAQVPSPELEAMRDKLTVDVKAENLSTTPVSYQLPVTNDGVCEILLDIDGAKRGTINFTLSNAKGEKVLMSYNVADQTLSFDRTQSGITDFSQDFPAVTVTPIYGKNLSLRLFIDRSSIEAFANNGRGSMTNLVFPTEPYTTLTVDAQGTTAKLKNLKIYSIK
ncbi:MAG: DUF4980 domain-containing protein [Muribaculaceae bacterium]|nr:DUF4980 domain-containing protein [Muribaculaceae bacterium]